MKLSSCATSRYVLATVFLLVLAGCMPFERRDPETSVTKRPLQPHPPTLSKFELAQQSATDRLKPVESILLDEKVSMQVNEVDEIHADAPVVKAAAQPPQVKAKLGARYFFIHGEQVKRRDRFCAGILVDKAIPAVEAAQPMTRVTYFSYTNNAPVIVCMRGQEFVELAPVPKDYQPPEGEDEAKEAIRVARQDVRIRDQVKDLAAQVILTDPEWRLWGWYAEGHGHRVLYVTFEQEGSGDPQYWAVVDLTEEVDKDKVRQAGADPKP